MALHETPEERHLALEIHRVFLKRNRELIIKFEKFNFEAISTSDVPCTDDPSQETEFCNLKMKKKQFIDKFGCRFPFMEQLTTNQSQVCNQDLKEKEKFWNSQTKPDLDCPFIQRCKRSMFKIIKEHENTDNYNISDNYISITSPIIQDIKDHYSYDMQSFIGEVGGTLGLMLGYSFMTLVDFLERIFLILRQKMSREN